MKPTLFLVFLLSVSACKREKPAATETFLYPWADSLDVVTDFPLPLYKVIVLKKELTPIILRKTLDSLVQAIYTKGLDPESIAVVQQDLKQYLEDQIHKISLSPKLDLYIVHIKNITVPYEYQLFLYNRQMNSWPRLPYYLNDTMDENCFHPGNRFLEPPIIRYQDVNGDGSKELIVKERVHNGTVYDAVVTRYLREDFMPLINIETITRLNHDTLHYIKRVPEFHHTTIIQHVLLVEKDRETLTDTLGRVVVETQPEWRILENTVKEPYRPIAISGSNRPDIEFLKREKFID